MKNGLLLFLFALVFAFGINPPGDVREFPAAPPYTVMIYMNGSDLESEFGAATDDLAEMLDSGLDARDANVLILTGGSLRWQNTGIPETECVIWRLADGRLDELHSLGRANMGDPSTLRDFIRFCAEHFPAEKTGLIMWDHGGGSIAGFGHDEKFDDASLTLLDMRRAFREAGLAENRLEFLGFDACLMATVEMAVLAAEFADVLIAAADLEPGEGWDYAFLAALAENPCGFALGEIIVDSFFEYFERAGLADSEILTLSVVDLAAAAPVMDALGKLAYASRLDSPRKFEAVATRRANTKTFGEGSPRDNYADMVDIGDMAAQLADIYPREAAAVTRALANAVTYSRHNLDVDIAGLSTFFIYGGKSEGDASLRTYSALEMNSNYTDFLHRFFDGLLAASRENKNEPVSDTNHFSSTELVLWQHIADEAYRLAGLSDSPGEWPAIGGEFAAMFPAGVTSLSRRYVIPALVNGREADIIVVVTAGNPGGGILGARYNSGNVFQKGHDPIGAGDEIALLHLVYDFAAGEESWSAGEPFIVEGELQLEWREAPEDFHQGYRHRDILGNMQYTPPTQL